MSTNTGKDTRVRLDPEPRDPAGTVRTIAGLLNGRIFLLGGRVPVVVRKPDRPFTIGGVHFSAGAMFLGIPSPGEVTSMVDEVARFSSRDGSKSTSCPFWVTQWILEAGRTVRQSLKPLAGITRVPIFHEDGTLATDGYDPESRIFVDHPRISRIAERPSERTARRALASLLHPFRGFGVDRDDVLEGAVTAAVLTATLRPALPAAPMVLVDGGEGGEETARLFARTLTALATGAPECAVVSGCRMRDRLDDALTHALVRAPDALLVEDFGSALDSRLLAAFVEHGRVPVVHPDVSEPVVIDSPTLVVATAAGDVVEGALAGLAIPVDLNMYGEGSPLPDYDPIEEVVRDRTKLLRSALTLAKWWRAVVNEDGFLPIVYDIDTNEKYEKWIEMVASPVAELLGVDVIDTMADGGDTCAYTYDPYENLILSDLAHRFEGRRFTSADAAAAVPTILWQRVDVTCDSSGEADVSDVDRWLHTMAEGEHGDYAITKTVDDTGRTAWEIRSLDDPFRDR